IQAFAQAGHPLVMFLDDMHWADSASLNFLQGYARIPDAHHMLFIGTYRENEVDASHPLTHAMNDYISAGNEITFLELKPLVLADLQTLLAETLHASFEQVRSLAEITLAKTGGNPFFVNEFLKTLYDEALIHFDMQRGVWEWNGPQIQLRPSTDN